MGDLDHFEAARAFERDVSLYEQIFSTSPACVAHDLHPDYVSTRYAQHRAAADNVQLVAVQHHHAHMASCMAENGLNERVIGVIWDGTGYGTDGTIWGGEFLVGDYQSFRRAAHLRYGRAARWREGNPRTVEDGGGVFADAGVDCSPLQIARFCSGVGHCAADDRPAIQRAAHLQRRPAV